MSTTLRSQVARPARWRSVVKEHSHSSSVAKEYSYLRNHSASQNSLTAGSNPM